MMPVPNLFTFAPEAVGRKHGPGGYANYSEYKDWLRDEFGFRCAYCLERKRWYPNRAAAFAVEHVLPQSIHPELFCVYDNLVYACTRCNSHKGVRQHPDPCVEPLGRQVRFREDGTAEAITPQGVRHIEGFALNDPPALQVRRYYLLLIELKHRSPADPAIDALFRDAFGYPDDLPDLEAKRPPSNSRPDGVRTSHLRRRADGTLPDFY